MDTLEETKWDIVISGTGLPQSLLALSLSRSGKKILHLDRNEYYGGDEAALSLSEAEEWAGRHSGQAAGDAASGFSYASITKGDAEDGTGKKLGFSRAYSLALAPQLLYARSNLLPALVSSRTHNQLEFQAVGSWFTVSKNDNDASSPSCVTRVPSGREDVFGDDSLDLRAKRALMKFLRFVSSYDEESEQNRWNDVKDRQVSTSLQEQFGLKSNAAIAPLLALALTPGSETETTMQQAVPRIARHLRSIGMFGAGFSAVLPKWGALAEIAQVACRACAVGGGVYVLGKGISDGESIDDSRLRLELSGGEKVTTKWLVGCPTDLPSALHGQDNALETRAGEAATRCICIVSSPLSSLFPPTSEGGVTPAGAVVVANVGGPNAAPVRILVHSSESGECPPGKCVLYASVSGSADFEILDQAVQWLLEGTGEPTSPEVLWRLQYVQHVRSPLSEPGVGSQGNAMILPPLSTDVVLDDEVLDNVRQVWRSITGEDEEQFMRFEAREGMDGEDEELS